MPGGPFPTIDEACDSFVHSLNAKPRTKHTYATGLRAFKLFLEEAIKPADQLTTDELRSDVLQEFYLWLHPRGYSPFTNRTYLAAAKALFSFLFAKDLLAPPFSLERAKNLLTATMKPLPYPIPRIDKELPRIIAYYDKLKPPPGDGKSKRITRLCLLRSRAIVHTLYSTAGRIAEVASLNRKDVADGRKAEAIVRGKGNKERVVFLTPEAQRAIRAYLCARKDTHQPLFISHKRNRGKRLSKVSIWKTVKRAARALRLEVTPHDFRHYRASQMLREGAPLEAIQELLGHADISTTKKVYAHYSKTSLRKIFDTYTRSPEEALKELEER
ncbi:MAG: tyrosine-type recombinase/integrase [Chloroflexota bacterium]|nr:tyrosine-type recombinase/integrase [Chloroflexota bacterium]